MAIFRFYAKKITTGEAVKVEVYMNGRSQGFTPDRKDQYLTVETSQSGSYEYYAKRFGKKVESGRSSGGNILIPVS